MVEYPMEWLYPWYAMLRWGLGILVVGGTLAAGALAHAGPAPLPAADSGGWQSLADDHLDRGEGLALAAVAARRGHPFAPSSGP
jgi:hypothetical protein